MNLVSIRHLVPNQKYLSIHAMAASGLVFLLFFPKLPCSISSAKTIFCSILSRVRYDTDALHHAAAQISFPATKYLVVIITLLVSLLLLVSLVNKHLLQSTLFLYLFNSADRQLHPLLSDVEDKIYHNILKPMCFLSFSNLHPQFLLSRYLPALLR